MTGVRLGGIDPSILRELSGVYKPFVKALKELVSNAFDADAEHVQISIADDCSSVTVHDDGEGMTPFEFRNDFTRIGGGSRRWLGERTRKGRLRIGSKGIGFLALARYCSHLEVESAGSRTFQCAFEVEETPATVELDHVIGFAIPESLLAQRLSCRLAQLGDDRRTLSLGTYVKVDVTRRQLHITRRLGAVRLQLSFDCESLAFRATLDFERLLELADKADLDKLNEFASIEIWPRPTNKSRPGTRITACNLKSFVRRELRTERRKGYVRNIASRDGLERLRWYQSRCTPVCYASTARPDAERLQERLPVPSNSVLRELRISHGGTSTVLKRPLYPLEPDALPLYDDMLIDVRIDEGGLKAAGFIAGYESVIFPAEYRGITVRVRGVAIGDPHFFGAEHLLTGASKAALSQITGEMKKYLLRIAHDLNVPVTVRKVPDGVIFWRSSDEDRHQAQEVASRLQGARHKRSRARGGQQRRPGTRTRTR
jgi:Histidine kinase-, DNA gyrase B-, and HSP90-like ATPase